MSFEIEKDATQAPNGAITTDRRLFLTEDQKTLVEEGDVTARVQLAAPGHQIPADEVKRLGLRLVKGRVIQGEPTAGKSEKSAEELAADDLSKRTAKYTAEAEGRGLTGDALADVVAKRLQVDELVASGVSKADAKKQVFGPEGNKQRQAGENK